MTDIFYAEAAKGYTIKGVFDTLSANLHRECFTIAPHGILLCDADGNDKSPSTIMFDIGLFRENFTRYIYNFKEPVFKISVNAKHLSRLVKNVKKKDSLILSISSDCLNKLKITIKPADPEKETSRREVNDVTIQTEMDRQEHEAIPDSFYEWPMNITSMDFQKIKKMSTVGKLIDVQIQGDNYISFYCDGADVYSTTLSFGRYKEDDTNIYKALFDTAIFNKLIKLTGLCNQIQFYAPSNAQMPLMIKLQAGNLGVIKVFIKDKTTLDFERSVIKNQEDE